MQSMPTRHALPYKHKTKPIQVEAALLTEDNASEISNWAGGAQVVEEENALTHARSEGLNVVTPDGKRRASVGMYVVKLDDQFFVAQPGSFTTNYEPI